MDGKKKEDAACDDQDKKMEDGASTVSDGFSGKDDGMYRLCSWSVSMLSFNLPV